MALVLHTDHQRPCARSTILATSSLDVRRLCAREYEQTFSFADAAHPVGGDRHTLGWATPTGLP